MIQFRGREQQRPEMGVRLLERLGPKNWLKLKCGRSRPRQDSRNMVMVLAPLRGGQIRRGQSGGGRRVVNVLCDQGRACNKLAGGRNARRIESAGFRKNEFGGNTPLAHTCGGL